MSTQSVRFMQAREGEDVFFVERITRPDGTLHVPGDFPGGTPVELAIYNRSSAAPGTPTYNPAAQALGSIVVSPLVVDGLWEGRDSTGYNFVFRLSPATHKLLGGRIYDVEFRLTGTYAGSALIKNVLFRVDVTPMGLV